MLASPKPPANVEEQAGSASANPRVSEEAKQQLTNNFSKYMKQSLTKWQVDKIREFADDAEVATILKEWKVTHEENSMLIDSLMSGQVKALELSRQLSSRLADLEEGSLQAQAGSLPPDNLDIEPPTETSDNVPPAAKAGKLETAGSPSNPGGTEGKTTPPRFQPAKSTTTPSPTSPADEEEVTRPPVNPFEELASDSEVDVERELTLHPEWAETVDQAGNIAAKNIASRWAENRQCSDVMQRRAASRERRKCVRKLRSDAEKALQANKDAGKRAASTADNDPLRLQALGGTSTHAQEGPGGGGARTGSGNAVNRTSVSCRRKYVPIGQIKRLLFERPPPTSGIASKDIRVLADGTMITEEEEVLERAVTAAADLNERWVLPRRVNIRTPVTCPIEYLSTDQILHFFPKDNYGIPKALREGDNWLRTVIIKNLNEMLSEDEFISRYLEPYGELTFTSLERFESHRVNACGRPKQYMIATFQNWMGAIRCLLAVNGIPRDPKLPSGRPYEVNLFNCNVDEVRHGPKIIDGKRYGAECLAGNGMWHSRVPWRNSRGQLTYPEYEWWWSNIRGGSDANLISLHRQVNEPDQRWIESYERETKKKVRSLERPQITDEEANAQPQITVQSAAQITFAM